MKLAFIVFTLFFSISSTMAASIESGMGFLKLTQIGNSDVELFFEPYHQPGYMIIGYGEANCDIQNQIVFAEFDKILLERPGFQPFLKEIINLGPEVPSIAMYVCFYKGAKNGPVVGRPLSVELRLR